MNKNNLLNSEVEQQGFKEHAYRKIPFKFKHTENGKLLSLHHTKPGSQENNSLRIRLGKCGFGFNILLVIDKRGNAFTFDLEDSQYWVLKNLSLPNVSVITSHHSQRGQFLLGFTFGQISLLDVVESKVILQMTASNSRIKEISLPGQLLQPMLALINAADHKPTMLNLDTFKASHRLNFVDVGVVLKFACYLPQSENILTCFSNDAVHIWSGISLNIVNILNPLKSRDRKLRLTGECNVPVFSMNEDNSDESEYSLDYHAGQDFTNGCLEAYCCKSDGSLIAFTTYDRYLITFSAHTFHMDELFRLKDFNIKQCLFLTQAQPRQTLILAITAIGQVLLLDLQHTEFKMIVQAAGAAEICGSSDSRFLVILESNGEASIWSVWRLINVLKAQEKCLQTLKDACKQKKTLTLGPTSGNTINASIMQQLKRPRLLAILKESGCYPLKYRALIWCALLKLPLNRCEFELLYGMEPLPDVEERVAKLKLKTESLKKPLLKLWSGLARWCKVLAHCDFLPHLIFPFVKLFPKNSLIAFEICVTLVHNQCQLWFEFHPLEPANFLGICENMLHHFDAELCNFYGSKQFKPGYFAWSLLSNGFSVVLTEEQWLQIWDHIVSTAAYFPIFCAVAYSLLQRENILRLPDKECIQRFFAEQNPIDLRKLIAKAYTLQAQCPESLHPSRFMKEFHKMPKNVYPKFLNYPVQKLEQHELNIGALHEEHRALDRRMRELELSERGMLQRLEAELKDEEQSKRIKEMELTYQKTLKREEERIVCQRKMLLLYQKEIRNRKSKMLSCLIQCNRRKRGMLSENDMDQLMHNMERERLRNDTNLLIVEEELRSNDFNIAAQKYFNKADSTPLGQKYKNDIHRLQTEQIAFNEIYLQTFAEPSRTTDKKRTDVKVGAIERTLDEIQNEFINLTK